MDLKKLLRGIVLLSLFAITSISASAQTLYDVEVIQEHGVWEPISGGEYITTGDDRYDEVPCPFSFYFDNELVTQVSANTNGFVAFNRILSGITKTPGSTEMIVAPINTDLYTRGEITSKVTGVAPKRTLIIQWTGVEFYSNGGQRFDFQVIIHEDGMIEMVYGPGFQDSWTRTARAFFSGSKLTSPIKYWNIRPKYPTDTESYFYKGNSTSYWMTNDIRDMLQPGFKYILGLRKPEITAAYPDENVNLIRTNVYGNGSVDLLGQGNDQRPRVELANVNNSTIHYTISGPVTFPVHPNYQIVYDATETFNTDGTHNLTNATLPLDDPDDNKAFGVGGILDLASNSDDIYGGVYKLNVDLVDGEDVFNYQHSINIAYTRNLEITKPIDPKSKNSKKYPLTANIPVKVTFTNRGLEPINEFTAWVRVYDDNDVQVWSDSLVWEANGSPLGVSRSTDVNFKNFKPMRIGEYKFDCNIEYLGDEESMDNTYPWRGAEDLLFYVAPEIEGEALKIVSPSNENSVGDNIDIFVGRPIVPIARFKNNGITDISDPDVYMTITRLSDDEVVYEGHEIVKDIPQGISNNMANQTFAEFTPPSEGDYKVCIEIDAVDDDIPNNNIICDTFSVVSALNGIYTVGPDRNTGNDDADRAYNNRNFTTIDEAVEVLFLRGMTGPVVFELTTNEYHVGDLENTTEAALDLRAQVIGMSDENTVTFRPSSAMSVSKGEVDIHLHSGSGIGILFGQGLSTATQNAVVNSVTFDRKNNYSNPVGKYIIDGGLQRALEFILHTGAHVNMNAVFYLSQGASNVTIKNTIVRNAIEGDKWDYYSLPVAYFSNPIFNFEPDARGANQNQTYSAGIVLRSIAPVDKIDFFDNPLFSDINESRMDTLVNENNIIENNEIHGFAYGIVSLGIGPLLQDGVAQPYYNENNTFTKNYIYNVSRAGIFLGHEKSSNVSYNKISGIANSVTGKNFEIDVAGIILGGEQRSTSFAYNNMDITIDGNEISNIGQECDRMRELVYGIKVEQSRNSYSSANFPDEDDNIVIVNNAIWGLRNNDQDVSRFGIRVATQRNTQLMDFTEIFKTPFSGTYFMTGVKVANNTVLIDDDGYQTNGAMSGIVLQQAYAPELVNNAIAMTDNNPAGSINEYAAVFYQGALPTEEGGILSDRNIFWLKADGHPTDSSALFRFVHTDLNSQVINAGYRNEFLTLNQWQMFTMNADFESVLGDFTADLNTPTVDDPSSKLRINSTPNWPKGSLLNNRGQIVDYIIRDIDGNPRGPQGQSYDIGAFEFPGILLNSDIEITTSHQPGAYRSTTTTFSDAEYIMTVAPVEVKAQIRNNGSLSQTGTEFTVRIYRENSLGGFYSDYEVEEKITANIATSEVKEISFNLDDGLGNEFVPVPYGDWNMYYANRTAKADSIYNVPGWFRTMQNNVTPLYRIVITAESDEDNVNNIYTKDVRFYLKRSALDMIVTVENSYYDMYSASSDDILAGRRNYDSLVAYLNDLGWKNQWKTDEIDTSLAQYFDVFERTAWEPRAVNYKNYKTLLWADAHENAITPQQILDLRAFVEPLRLGSKKNLVIGSQEMSRLAWTFDQDFTKEILSAEHKIGYPTDPMDGPVYSAGDAQPALNITDDTKYIEGVNVDRLHRQFLLNTGLVPADPNPVPGLMSLFAGGEGLAYIAYKYNEDEVASPEPKETTMGTATTTLDRNVVYLGVDWRHYADGEEVMRACLDFLNQNGGEIIPVELISFDADFVDNRVELAWQTANELNSARFEVERAEITETGRNIFTTVAVENAAGKSTLPLNYNAVDYGVKMNAKYAYRLKMIDIDGEYDYSGEVVVETDATNGMTLSEATPNPATYSSEISFSVKEDAYVEIALFDMTGKKVMTLYKAFANAGSTTLPLDLSSLNSGVYSYVMKVGDNMISKQIQVVK